MDDRRSLNGEQGSPSTDWRRSGSAEQGLRRYATALRERLGLIVAVVLLTTAAAAAYLLVAPKTYEAASELFVTPVSGDEVPPGVPLLRDSPDPTRDVETAAKLVTSRDVAARVRNELGLRASPEELLAKIEAQPIAQSNIVAVTARDGSADGAADLANAFGSAVVADRTEQLHRQLDGLILRLRARVAADPQASGSGSTGATLADQVAQLETLRAGDDPTLELETKAAPPTGAASPRTRLTLLAGVLAGLILGVGGAFALHAIDPRLRREEQLRERYTLPILARIPREMRARTSVLGARRFRIGPRRRRRRALAPGQLSPATLESYRTLRAMVTARSPAGREGRSLLVTGPSPSEGKTTTALNLASSFALAGNRVILIEADFRRPTVGDALGVKAFQGIGKVLLGNVGLEQALVPTEPFGDQLRVLLVERADEWLPEVLSLPTAASLLKEAERLADFVIVDSPPLTEVIDALPLAQQVDDVVVVVRLGSSRLTQLERLVELLSQNNIHPSGFALVGVGSSEKETYYLSGQRERAAMGELEQDTGRSSLTQS